MQLSVRRINKSFGEKHVLKDLSFEVNGGAFGLLGRNGAGKSTTIRIIMEMFLPDSGEVLINGKPAHSYLGKIGYLPEERGLYPKRVIADQMAYIGALRGMRVADARKRGLELLTKIGAEEYYKKRLDTLSKGNQQKIQIAIALISDPELVILDEPFSGLDPVNAKVLKDLVTELVAQGRTVIFSSHQMSYVEEFCSDLCMIDGGEIVASGNLAALKKSYPRNRILLVPEQGDASVLAKAVLSQDSLKGVVTGATADARGCMVTLKHPNDKTQLFNVLAQSGVDIDVFKVAEPSLEEIFVEKCGGVDAAVQA